MTGTIGHQQSNVSRQRPRRPMVLVVLATSIFVVAGLLVTGVLPIREYLERGAAVAAAQEELDQLLAENEALSVDIDALYTEQEIERIAREQYGFVKEGEIGYAVVVPEVDVPSTEPIPPVSTVVEKKSLLQRFWDFITGSDSADDG